MAKQRKPGRLRPETRVRRAARVVLTASVKATFACLPAALDGAAEAGIHDMRVNAKKLREGFRLFRPVYGRELVQDALNRVDQFNDLLGLVRDTDVLLEHLDLFDLPSTFLDDFAASIRDRRAARQADLVPVLRQAAEQRLEGELLSLIEEGRRPAEHKVAGAPCRRFARAEISERLNRTVQRMAAVHGEDDAAGLHRVRVANKRLRYGIEPFLPVFDRRLATAYRRVAELHTTLGDLHDLDVLGDALRAFAAAGDRHDEVVAYLERLAEHRAREYGRVQTFFGEHGEATFVRLVGDAID